MKHLKLLLLSLCLMVATSCVPKVAGNSISHKVTAHILVNKQNVELYIDTAFTFSKGDTICVTHTLSRESIKRDSPWEFCVDKPVNETTLTDSYRIINRIAVVDHVDNDVILIDQ